jgi:hypothetical protein
MLTSGVLLRGQERTSRRFRAGTSARSASAVGKKLCDFLTQILAPAKPHCCGKALNATSTREVGDGVVAQSGR